jgi:acetyl-CoA carboxylase biotin carboxyl carrier protein
MSLEEIGRLSEAGRRAGIALLEISSGGMSVRLKFETCEQDERMPPPVPSAPPVRSADNRIRSPGVGLFRLAHPATGRSPVHEGQTIGKGQVVGFLQIGPTVRPVVAPKPGVLGEPLVEDGRVVGYGTPLFPLR